MSDPNPSFNIGGNAENVTIIFGDANQATTSKEELPNAAHSTETDEPDKLPKTFSAHCGPETVTRRRVSVIDAQQQVKAVIVLEGDITSVDGTFKATLEVLLKQYGGSTIQVNDIASGSIRVSISGSQADIERLREQIDSGNLTELNGFQIRAIERVSDDVDDIAEESIPLEQENLSLQKRSLSVAGNDKKLARTDLNYKSTLTIAGEANQATTSKDLLPNIALSTKVHDSILVAGDSNTIHQGPSHYTTNIFGASQAEQNLSQLKALRRNLLRQMKTDVAQRLDDSLHNLIRVDLAEEEQRHQVGRRRKEPLVELTLTSTQAPHDLIQRQLAVSNNNETLEPIPPAEQTYTIFHRSDIGGRLLILGEPGSGKTTELLMVAQRLVDRAIEDSTQPIPLIFELSSWQPNTPILNWLGQQLKQSYGVSKKLAEPLAQQLIQQGQLLPLLDGLDELGQRNQIECIKALEDFLAQYPTLPTIICCRQEEYEQGGKQLQQLNGAIYLQAIGPQQIQQYLRDLRREQLWQGIQTDPELLKLAQSPLFLTMLVSSYQGQPIHNKSSLFNAYIHKQLHEPSHQGTYKPGKDKSPQQTLHYLGWLARQMKQRNETEFLIEKLQPDWLANQQQTRIFRLIFRLISGLMLGLIGGLSGGLIAGLFGGLGAALQHFVLRIILAKNGYTPWNYALFLEHAVQHRFIQRTGGRYRFIHDLLREHFAQMTPQQQEILAQPDKH